MSDAITIDLKSLQSAIKKVVLPEETMNRILQLTVSRTAKWAATRLKNQLGKATQVSGKILKGRMAISIKNEGQGYAHIWLGLNPISLGRFNPVQTPSGVTTDVKEVPGAFIWQNKVFKRSGASRLPIEKQNLEIESKADPVFSEVIKQVEKALFVNFEKAYLEVLTK